jgi:pimeloyl-ACP methyl ester carboxylesterase
MSASRSHFISAPDGLRLHARVWGPEVSDLTPVVCLPGLTRNGDDFIPLAQRLARADAPGGPRRVAALDYRGRGLSDHDPDWRHYDLRVENADILACLAALEIGEAVIVGTSRGGLHAMLFAAVRPALLRGVVLNDIGPVIEAQGLARIRSYVGKMPAPCDWEEAVDLMRTAMGGRFPALSPEDWRVYAEGTFAQGPDGRLALRYDPALMRTLEQLDLDAPPPSAWPQFEGLAHAPVLAIRGETSDLLSEETLAQMQARHPACAVHVVAGQGHAPLLRDAPTLARIEDFIAAAAPPG